MTARDANSNPVSGVVVSFPAVPNVSGTGGTCTTSAVAGPGFGTCSVTLTSTVAGSYAIRATIGGVDVGGSPATLTVTAGPPVAGNSSLVLAPSTIVGDGVSASSATVTVRDANSNLVSGVVVSFPAVAGVSGTGGTCTTSAVAGPGFGTCSVSLTSTVAGSYAIRATVGGVDVGGSPATLTVTAGAPNAGTSTWTVAPAGPITADGVAAYTVTFTAKDANGNTVTTPGTVFAVPAVPNLTASAPSCTTGGTGTCTLTFTSTIAGSYLITATLGVGGPALTNPANHTLVFVAGPPNAGNSSLVVTTGTRVSDGVDAHTATVTVRDTQGNVVAGATVVFSVIGATGSGSVVTGVNGEAQISITSTTPGFKTVSATVNGLPVNPPSAQVQFVAGAASASNSTLVVSTGNRIANGSDAHTATVTVRDSFNNPVSGASVVFGVCAGASATTPGLSDVNGVVMVAITSNTPGSCGVTATIGGVGVSGSPASVVFVVGPVDVSASSFVIDAGPKTADGVDAYTLTVTAMDSFGHVVPGVTVDFAAQVGATLGASSGVTNGSGVASTTATATVAGTYQLSATIGGVSVPGSPQPGVFVAGPVNAGLSDYTVTAGTVLADGVAQHQATVVAKDANGNPVSGVTVDFAVPAGATGSAPSVVTDGSGSASITITSTIAGTYSIGATIAAVPVDGSPKSVTFGPGAADATTSSWVVTPPGPITADGVAAYTATATARDAFSNLVVGAQVTFTVPPQVVASAGSCTTDGTGTCSVTFTSTTAGSYTATAGIGANLIAPNRTLVYVAGAASTGTSTIVAVPTSIPADGVAASTITVQLVDAQGNPLTASGGLVVISASVGTISLTTDNGDGTYTATLTSTGVQGTTTPSTVSFTINAIPAAATATVILVDAVAPPPPTVNPTNGTTVSGTGQTPGDIITVRNAANVVIGTGTVAADGSFSFTIVPTPTPVNGDVISVTDTDAAGNESLPTFVTVMVPIDPSTSTFVVSTGSRVADGVDAHTATLTARDVNNNPVGGAQVFFTVSGGATGGGVVTTDPAGVAQISITSLTSGSKAIVVYEGTNTSGTVLGSGTVLFVSGAATPGNSTLVLAPTTIVGDGVAASTATVTARDSNLNLVPGVVITFPPVAGVTISAGTCTTSAVAGPGFGTCSVTLTSTVAGTYPIHATIGGTDVSGSPATLTVTAGPPTAGTSSLVLAPSTIVGDGASASTATVTARDANSNLVSGVVVTFPPDPNVSASSASCTTSAAVGPGFGTCSVTLTSTVSGTYPIHATIGGTDVGGSPATLTVTAGPPSAGTSTWTVAPVGPVTADGVAAYTVTFTAKDANGNTVTTPGTVFAVPAVAGLAASAPSCTTGGAGTCTITFTSTVAASYTISATLGVGGPALTSPASHTLTFIAGPPSPGTSTLVLAPSTIVGDGVSASTATVTAQDANSNLVAGVVVTFPPVAGVTASAGSCTTSAVAGPGFGTCSVTLTSTVAGSYPIHATVGGVDVGGSPATLTVTAGAPVAGTSTLVLTPATIVGDGVAASTATVTARDANSNLAPGAMVSFPPVAGVSGTGGSCTTSAVAGPGFGTCSVTLTSTVAGSYPIHATIGGTDVGGSPATLTVTAGAADAGMSTWTVAPAGPITANGVAAYTVTFTAKDANGNTVTTPGTVFAVPAVANLTASAPSCTTGGTGTCTLTFTSTVAGSYAITATLGVGGPALTSPATQNLSFIAGAPTAGTSTWTVAPAGPVAADGVAAYTVTFTAKDANGNTVTTPGTVFAVPAVPNLTASAPSCTTGGTGTCTLTFTSTVAASYTITATLGVGGPALTNPASHTLTFIAGPPSPGTSTLALAPSTIVGDGVSASTATVTVNDANSNPVPGVVVTFPMVAGVTASAGTCTTSAVAGPGFGTCSVTLTSTVSGTYPIHATIAGTDVGGSPATLTVTAGAPNAGTSTWTVAPVGPVTADGVAAYTVTFTAKDANGNTVTTPGTVFAVPAVVNLTASAPSCATGGTGTCTLTFTSTVAASYTITATLGVGGPALTNPANHTLVFVSGPPVAGTSTLVLTPTTIVADGVSASTATVTVNDANGNPVPGAAVAFPPVAGVSASAGTCTTSAVAGPGFGTCSVTLTSTVAGSYPIHATVGGTDVGGSPATLTVTAGSPSPAGSTWTVAPAGPITADGVAAYTVTFTAKDANGNTVTTPGTVFAVPAVPNLTASAPSCTTGGTGTCTLMFTSTVAASYAITATLGVGGPALTNPATQNLSFIAGAPSAGTSTWTVAPAGPITADGVAAYTVTFTAKDANGNTVTTPGTVFAVPAVPNLTASAPSCTTGGRGRARSRSPRPLLRRTQSLRHWVSVGRRSPTRPRTLSRSRRGRRVRACRRSCWHRQRLSVTGCPRRRRP